MNSPTIFDHVSITSVSCRPSRSPRRCIIFGTSSAGNCQRSARILLSGKPRHSAITAARREGFINKYLATDGHGWNTDFLKRRRRRVLDFLRLTQPPLQLSEIHFSVSAVGSIFPPHVTWQNIQLGAVLGHGAARDRDPALAQDLDYLVIAY